MTQHKKLSLCWVSLCWISCFIYCYVECRYVECFICWVSWHRKKCSDLYGHWKTFL